MGLHVLLLFLSFKCIFNDCCQTNYLTIYQIYLGQIFRIGRTMAADDQAEFCDYSKDVAVATNFC